MPEINDYMIAPPMPPMTANPNTFKYKSGNYDISCNEFNANKQKVKSRLNNMYRESLNNFNNINSKNSVGQRVLIKNSRGGNIEDRFYKTARPTPLQ